jgi:peptide/nickel transport system substrate-binding protein
MERKMNSKISWLILSCLLVLLLLASCGTKTTTTTTPTTSATITTKTVATTSPPTKTTTPTSTTLTKPVPQFGGILTIRYNKDPLSFDPYFVGGSNYEAAMYLEFLGQRPWSQPRNVWSGKLRFTQDDAFEPCLADSWEQPDALTIIFHIHKGVMWQDKPPVNGREFTAYDAEYSWHRLAGLGSGFTKPSTYVVWSNYEMIQSITATDKYTLVFKMKYPSIDGMHMTKEATTPNLIVPREVIEKYGDMKDWKNCVGTGPFIVKDYVSGSSVTYIKNQNYWGYDTDYASAGQRYPQNRLPYVNQLSELIIPDVATTLAALRTGKIDLLGTGSGDGLLWNQAQSMANTNPEILQTSRPMDGYAMTMRVDKTPFTDIRVRKAMNMAIDRDTIAKTYYGGVVDGTPVGMEGPAITKYATPFSEWPKDVQDGYTYNPTGAKKLLADAGYPNGFKTNVVLPSNWDTDLAQIFKAYFSDIGVDMEINLMDTTAYNAFTNAKKQDAMASGSCARINIGSPLHAVGNYRTMQSGSANTACVADPNYEDLYTKAQSSNTYDDMLPWIKKTDQYAMSQYWAVYGLPRADFAIWQPWLGGYQGEAYLLGPQYARLWIQQDVKKSMGR